MGVAVSKTGVNLGHQQTVVWSGLTDAPRNSSGGAWTQGGRGQAISEAEAATGLSIILVTFRLNNDIDVGELNKLKG